MWMICAAFPDIFLLVDPRSSLLVIGAAGGQFWAGSFQLQNTLRSLAVTTVVFFPDAGAIANTNVLIPQTNVACGVSGVLTCFV